MSDLTPPGDDVDAMVASLRADASDIGVFFQVLAAKLHGAMPEAVVLEREKGLFSKKAGRPVQRITVQAGDDIFEAVMHQGAVTCRHIHAGHTIGSGMPFDRELSLDQWLQDLFQLLAHRAQTNAAASAALRALVT